MRTYKNLVEAIRDNAHTDIGIHFFNNLESEDFLSYADLLSEAENCLSVYQSVGLKMGDELLLLYKSSRTYVIAYWACILGGIIPIPLSYPENQEDILRVFNVWSILKHPRIATDEDKLRSKLESFSNEKNMSSVFESMSSNLICHDHIDCGGKKPYYPEINPEDTAYIQFSSGSTGNPKGVTTTHRNLMCNINDLIDRCGIQETDCFLCWVPLSHNFGMIFFHLFPLVAGVQQYRFPTDTFIWNPVLWLSAANKYRATVIGSPSFGYKHFLKRFNRDIAQSEQWDLSRIKVMFNGSERISASIANEFEAELGNWGLSQKTMMAAYGLSEATIIVATSQLTEGIRTYSINRNHMALGQKVKFADPTDYEAMEFADCGISLKHTEIRITDDERKPLGEDTIGHVEAKGANVTQGYYSNPEATREILSEDGWLDSKDLGFIHNGRLVVVGRIKEMIIIGGVNYIPQDIEQAILHSKEIDKQNEYIACGVPNQESGTEDLIIFVGTEKKYEEFLPVVETVRRQVLDALGLKVARVLPVKQIPKTKSAKIQRFKLVQAYLNGDFQEFISRFGGNDSDIISINPLPTPSDFLKIDKLTAIIREEVEKLLGRSGADINAGFTELGLNSLKLMMLQENLEKRLKVSLSSTAVLDYPSISGMANLLSKQKDYNRKSNIGEIPVSSESGAIAVVGMACRFPGGVDSPGSFWHLLNESIDPVKEIPEWRWNKDPQAQAEMSTRMGGFLDDIDKFDPLFFGISPVEAEALDPQHRLLLELAWEAFEDAGWNPKSLSGSRTGVFVGIAGSDYLQLGRDFGHESGTYTITGTMLNGAAGRISYAFGLQGPCMAIDTACSSSLVALHQGVLELRAHNCEVALAAGVNLILRAQGHASFSKLQALAESGRCRSFDEAADGYIRSEGGTVLVLKRLEDARKDGDQIWGIIKGTAVNHNGHSGGFTVPSGPAQQQVIRQAIADAGLKPDDIDYLEAHGSGTKLGDPQEVNALAEVFGGRTRPLYIGSIKSNLGHLETAAGLAGLCKVLVSMRHGRIPSNLHFNKGNPLISWDNIPLKVVDRHTDWEARNGIRRAGISSFGISGINSHVVVESAHDTLETKDITSGRSSNLFTISTRTEASMREYVRMLSDWCRKPTAGISALCRTLSLGRASLTHRLALNVESMEALSTRLLALAGSSKPLGVDAAEQPGKLVFLFTGQGSQYHNMADALYRESPVFKKKFDELDKAFKLYVGASLVELIYGNDSSVIQRPLYAQPLIFSIEVALAHYWESIGIVPDIMIGHSIGEYAAAYMSGVMSFQDAVYMVAARAEIMDSTPPQGRMVGVLADEVKVRELIECYEDVSIAAINAPENITVSGGKASIDDLVQRAHKARIFIEELEVSHPFHSVLMRDGARRLEEKLSGIKFHTPSRCFISTCTGTFVSEEKLLDAAYWGHHLEKPVLFSAAINTALSAGGSTFLEIGATATLSGLAAQNINSNGFLMLPSLRKNKPAWSQIHESMGQLWQAGYSINWKSFYGENAVRLENLPHTPYERMQVWFTDTGVTAPEKVIQSIQSAEEVAAAFEPSSESADTSEIREELKEMMAQVTGVSAHDISDSLNLFTLGLDSLMLVQLGKSVLSRFQIDIPVKTFFAELHTIEKLTGYILKNQPVSKGKPSAAEAGTGTGTGMHLVSDGVQGIINRQLAIMEEQLRLLDPNNTERSGKSLTTLPQRNKPVSSKSSMIDTTSSRSIQLTEDALTPRQQKFLDSFIERWTARTRKSKEYAAEYREGLADWIMSLNFSLSIKELVYPLVSVKSKGSKFTDIDGNEYLDTAIGYGVSYFGHNPDFIVDAIRDQLDKGFELGPQSNTVGEVTELIREFTGVERVAYCNTGTEAIMVALRLARTVSGRDKIARFITSFHGSFDGVLADAGGDYSQPMALGIPQSMVEDTVVLRYGSDEAFDTIRKYGTELAAVLVEPVQTRNPGLQPKEFLHKLRALCSELKIALIFDEIVTGFRIELGGAQAYFDIKADLVTYGKLVAGGMPIGIVAGKSSYMDAVDGGTWSYGDKSGPKAHTTFFAGTFCKHPLTMAACKAVLHRLKAGGEALIEEVNERTRRFVERSNAYFAEARVPIKTLQFASIYRLEAGVSTNMATFPLELNLFFRLMMEAGVYVWERRTCFFSAAHTDEDVELILKALRYSVEAIRAGGFEFRAVDAPDDPNKPTKSNQNSFRLSSEERRVYIMSSLKGGNEAYQVRYRLILDSKPDIDKLKNAFKLVADNHELLRSSFGVEGSEVVHHIAESVEPEYLYADIRAGDSLENFEEQWKRPFDLSKAPLWRWGILVDNDGRYNIIFNFHHIISDGPSADVILKDLEKAANGASLQKPSMTYKDYVEAEKIFLASPEAFEQRDWWLRRLSPLPPSLNLPNDGLRPSINEFRGNSKFFTLDIEVLSKVKELARKCQTTHFMVFLAAWAAFLGRAAVQSDFCIGIPWNKRNNDNFDGIVGMFAQTLVLRLQPESSRSFADFLSSVKEMCLGAYGNAEYPLDKLLEALNVPRNLGRNPLFDVMFIYENGQQRTIELGGIHSEPGEVKNHHAAFDLTLEMIEFSDKLFCSLNYAVPLFSESRIEEWIGRFKDFLNEVVLEPSRLLGEIRFLREDEEKHLLGLGTGPIVSQTGMTAGKIITEAFSKHSAKAAVWFKGKELTYKELDIRAGVLASKITALGIGKEDIVGILLPRTPEMLAANLAVLKSGAAWLPLDLSYPEERIRYMLDNSGARLLLCEADVAKRYNLTIPAIDPAEVPDTGTLCAPYNMGEPGDLAYLIFTSGSTGRPKGVQLEQGSLANFLVGMAKALDWTPESRTACLTTFSFDICLLETLLCLSQGGCVVLADEKETIDPVSIAQLIRDGRVDCLQMTPTRLQLLLTNKSAAEDALSSIKTLIVGGEAFPKQLLPVLKQFEALKIFNVYGPTETCIWSACKDMTLAQNVGIGLPIDNTRIYVLDSCKRLVPQGVEGDLWIGGTGVARGYVNNSELTAECFTDDLIGEGKMYRTGDRARWNSDELECLGRDDDQVKIRGYRIELGEIEEVMRSHPAVANAAAAVQELDLGNRILVSYFQLKPGMTASQDEIKAWVAGHLPEYMVPAYLAELSDIPQTQNGKIDRNALPKAIAANSSTPLEEPQHQLDSILIEVWKKFLGDRPIGIHNSFFDMGGNSFSLVLMQAELEKIFPGVISVADLFANPTIARLRQYINSSASGASAENEGILSLSSSWFGTALGEEGRISASLTPELVSALKELAGSYRTSPKETIMSLFALYLNKELGIDNIPLWLLGDSERVALRNFNFYGRSDFGEVLSELSSSVLPSGDFTLVQTLGPAVAKEYGVRVGFAAGRGLDMHRLLRYLDFVLVAEESEGELCLAVEYSQRLEGAALRHHLNRFLKLLNLVVGKTKAKGEISCKR